MVFRAIKTVRLLVMFMVLAALLWIYAYLPDTVFVPDESTVFPGLPLILTKGVFFYAFLLAFAVTNVVFMLYFNIASRGVAGNAAENDSGDMDSGFLYVVWVGIVHIVIQLFLLSIWLHVGLSNIVQVSFYQGELLLLAGPALLVLALVLLPVLKLLSPATRH